MIMTEKYNPIKERCTQTLRDDPAYRKENMNYLRSIMKPMDQEELIGYLRELNYKQLKIAVGSGVPGHAQAIALTLLKEKREALDAFIASDGASAEMETEVSEQEPSDVDTEERVASPDDYPTEES